MADKIILNENENEIYEQLKILVDESHEFYKGHPSNFDEQRSRLIIMSDLAHKLHFSLKERGYEPKHHGYMYKNRGVSVENIEFYNHLHPVEDLLKFIEDPDANNDPVDTTLGEKFEFRIYTRRWEHYDYYQLTRTEEGWEISGGSAFDTKADKEGNPAVFEALEHDSVSYPRTLGIFLEWVWDKAFKGATKEVIQAAINDLGEWISLCEQSTPQGFFEGLI